MNVVPANVLYSLPRLPKELWANSFSLCIDLPLPLGEIIRQYSVQSQQCLLTYVKRWFPKTTPAYNADFDGDFMAPYFALGRQYHWPARLID